jgi:hypothetical protein
LKKNHGKPAKDTSFVSITGSIVDKVHDMIETDTHFNNEVPLNLAGILQPICDHKDETLKVFQ